MACLTIKRSLDLDHIPNHTQKRQRCNPAIITQPSNSSQCESYFAQIIPKITSEDIEKSVKFYSKRIPKNINTVKNENDNHTEEKFPISLFSLENMNQHKNPLFTLSEVKFICEKLIKEREEIIREEYDKILYSKLSEQYEAFVKFNTDYLHKKHCDIPLSYVS
ncbi:akirin-2-like isoform X1 [Gordionus sp. m RMFG-2023]|uniref:akirin-2-like isoform X1 n=1 Tax=Gordionus sp. m RMFG-2023 TaxID=3053472 RepID=UPI0031FCD567